LGYHYFGPKIKIIAPWRIWKLKSRTDLINYAKKHGIDIPKDKKGAPSFFRWMIIYFTHQLREKF
jgi:argininosuccinate synthase